jgi:AraC-like DNA-binding protein
MAHVPPARHLLRAKDLADARYFEPLGVDDLASAAGLSRAHFSREFRRAFGESPHAYLLTRRLTQVQLSGGGLNSPPPSSGGSTRGPSG